MSIEEVIAAMETMIDKVKSSAEAKRVNVSESDQIKIDNICKQTSEVINSAIAKVKETVELLNNQEEIDNFLSKVSNKCREACDFTIQKINKFNEVNKVEEKVESLSEDIINKFDNLMDNEEVKEMIDTLKGAGEKVVNSFEEFMNAPQTQENIKKAKEMVIKAGERTLNALKAALSEED